MEPRTCFYFTVNGQRTCTDAGRADDMACALCLVERLALARDYSGWPPEAVEDLAERLERVTRERDADRWRRGVLEVTVSRRCAPVDVSPHEVVEWATEEYGVEAGEGLRSAWIALSVRARREAEGIPTDVDGPRGTHDWGKGDGDA